ncbi:MAG: PAS domain-containing protein, partial [Chromatiaceae bacterium]|nr:PAS domain-containing protein [Chromatiaceae bacterium]
MTKDWSGASAITPGCCIGPPRFAAVITTPDGQDFLGFSAADLRESEDLRGRQIHEPDRERVLAAFAGAYESGEDFVIQYRLWDREREVLRDFQDYGHIERDSLGRPTAITGVLVDITARVASDGAVDGFIRGLTEQEEARRALAESE